MEVEMLYEIKRGCGYRKPSKDGVGIYLMGPNTFEPCERLPFPLTSCPVCGEGIKFSRGFSWINPMKLFDPEITPKCDILFPHNHATCSICTPSVVGEKAGLKWIGKKHYTPLNFIKEANDRGISIKISAIPKGFEIGKHIIYLAHKEACFDFDGDKPFHEGVFMTFRPTWVDLVIKDENNIPDKAKRLVEFLGEEKVRLVKVKPQEDWEAKDNDYKWEPSKATI